MGSTREFPSFAFVRQKKFACVSNGIARLFSLSELLDAQVVLKPRGGAREGVSAVLAWGRKPTALKAERFGARHNLPLLRLEDGFCRSVDLGDRDPPLSIAIDDLGIYYDASCPSRLEWLISQELSGPQRERALAIAFQWQQGRVSKYNHLREYSGQLPARYVLVADQTFGDASIRFGLAGSDSFQRMLQAALDENPECTVLLKIHPDVFAGKKQGHFDVAQVARNPQVQVLAEDVHPVRLIENAEAVYVVTSQMGFEGLLWGKPVRTFGMPFYGGWGLTQDELPAPERRGKATLEQLVHAALVDYPRYINPETGKRCEVGQVLAHLALQRRMRERFPPVVYATGFSRWKKRIVRDFLWGSEVRFVRDPSKVPAGGTVVVWGRRDVIGSLPPENSQVNVIRLEDGFLRSVGLGADLVRPLSWVMDQRGIYYDATQPSDLEYLLQNSVFDESLVSRAAALRERLVAAGLTKYNVGDGGWLRPEERTDSLGYAAPLSPSGGTQPTSTVHSRHSSLGPHVPDVADRLHPCSRLPGGEVVTKRWVILVPGQVESDASLAYGAPGVRRNLDLLRAVREANPDAYVVYKPHPDVVAGLRRQGQGEDAAEQWCDEVVVNVGMGVLLPKVDEVHTLTSLTGFEALLRGKKVTCYGQPFYAGWGLTTDIVPPERRTRKLTLDELVAGTLILYPTYVSRTTGRFTTPERALDELLEWRERGATTVSQWRKAFRWVLRMTKG